MFTNQGARFHKVLLGFMLVTVLLSLFQPGGVAAAQEAGILQTADQSYIRVPPHSNEIIQEHIINGPPEPPPGFEAERQPVEVFAASAVTLEGVPAYTWTGGCSAGAGGMSTAYLDNQYTNLIDGVMPPDDSSMPEYTSAHGETFKINPAITSLNFFTDYWEEYRSPLSDPFLRNSSPAPRPIGEEVSAQGWMQHAWEVLGDFMYTSQSTFGNIDGSTKFYTYPNSASRFTCDEMSSNSKPDGTLGTKLYYETRGYAVGDCYNQLTSNVVSGGYSLAQYKAEINAGRPVMLHLGGQSEDEPGHTVVGIGYDTASSTIYIHDGWDLATHQMTWGGSYSAMPLQMVSIVTIVPGTPGKYTITGNVGVANAIVEYTGGNTTSDANGDYSFEVVSGWFGDVKPSKTGVTFTPARRSFANVTSNVVAQNFNDVNLLQDPGFESGTFNNTSWDGYSTIFGTPLCTAQQCDLTETLARTGQIWAWFGGVEAPQEIATLSQTVTIPSASSASLDFYLWISNADAGSDANDVFRVKVDGTTVFTTNATQLKYYVLDYRPINVNLSAYADGSLHEIEFSAVTTQQAVSFHLDDVSLTTDTPASSEPGEFPKINPPNNATGQPTNPTLSWGDSANATEYEYCYDDTNDNSCAPWVSTGTSTSVNITGLDPGKAYYWQVRSSNAHDITYANVGTYWKFTTATATPPGAFNKLSPTNGAKVSSSVKLKWGTSANASSYEYCHDMTDDDACDSDAWITNGTGTSVDLSGLETGKHYWQVRAVNDYGNTSANTGNYWSFEVVAETVYSGTTSRGWPMSFTVSPTGTKWNEVTLKTDYPACSLTLEVTVTGPGTISSGKFSIAGSFSFVAQINASGTASGTYSFKNYFVFGCGNINQSGTWTASKPIPPKVTSVTRINPSPTRADNVQFKVRFSEPVTGVDVSGPPFGDFALTTGAGLSNVAISSVGGSGTEYIVTVNTGIGNGTIRLDVIDQDSIVDGDSNPLGGTGLGNGNYSAGAVYKVNRGTPSVPSLIAPASNALVTDYTPKLDWSNSTIPVGTTFDHYQLWVATDAAFTNLVVDESIPVITSSAYTFPSDLTSNSKFYWKVRAFNYKGGTSKWSAYRSFRTALTRPTLLSPVTPYDALTLRPTFDWGDVMETGVTGYTIQISTSSTFAKITHTSNPVSSTYTPGVDLPRNKLLHWRVRTRGANGPSAWSEVRSFNSANAPTTPVLSLPALNALNTNYTPLFKWRVVTVPAPSVFKHYQLQVDDNKDFSNPVIDDISITDRPTVKFQVVTPLAHNTKFFWRVRAVNTDDEVSNWSAVRYFRTAIDAPVLVTPTNGATAVSRVKPRLDWENVPGNTGYVLQVWKAGSTPVLVKSVTLVTDVSQYEFFTNLRPNTAYYWKVKTKGVNGPSLWSGPFNFTTGP